MLFFLVIHDVLAERRVSLNGHITAILVASGYLGKAICLKQQIATARIVIVPLSAVVCL